MGLDLTAATIIRSGGALVWIAVGLVIALAGRRARSWGLRGIATYCIAFGCSVIPLNITVSDPRIAPYGMAVYAIAWTVAAAAILVFFARGAPPAARRDRVAWGAAALGLVSGAATFAIGLDPTMVGIGPGVRDFTRLALGV